MLWAIDMDASERKMVVLKSLVKRGLAKTVILRESVGL